MKVIKIEDLNLLKKGDLAFLSDGYDSELIEITLVDAVFIKYTDANIIGEQKNEYNCKEYTLELSFLKHGHYMYLIVNDNDTRI